MAKLRLREFGEIRVPAWVVDHPSFLKWLRSGAVPEDIKIGYINNEVWTDTEPESAFSHNAVRVEVGCALSDIADDQAGLYFGAGMTFTSMAGGFTAVPDGIFVCRESIDTGRVTLTGGRRSHHDTELVGTPDLVIEIVSDSSVYKDTEWLMANYWNAEVAEYWVVDGRTEPLQFTVYRRGEKGFVAVRRAEGWSRSPTLGKSFRFVAGPEEMGFSTYRLEVR